MKACVVGHGHLGRHHARIYKQLDSAELVGISDTDPEARKAASALGAPVFEEYGDLLDKAEVVSIVTPTYTHLAVAREFINAGVSVLVEKPLAKTLEQAMELTALAEEKGVTLQVGHIERFNPVVAACEGLLKTPRFIQADRVSPFSFRSMDIGVVMDVMIHDIDLILHVVGSRVKEIAALGVPVLGGREDIANARIVFENGCVANVTASRVALKTERKIRIFQEDAYFSLDLVKQEAAAFRRKGALDEKTLEQLRSGGIDNPLALMLSNFIEHENIKVEEYDMLTREIENFMETVREGGRPKVTGEDGVEAIRVANMILENLEHPPWAK